MKKRFLIFLLAMVFGGYEVFAKCPSCPEKMIKKEATSASAIHKKKQIKNGSSAERLQKKTIRKEPTVSSTKTPFPSPVSYILKKENEITLPDGTVLKLVKPEDLEHSPDLP